MEQVGLEAAEERVVDSRITRLGKLNLDVVDQSTEREALARKPLLQAFPVLLNGQLLVFGLRLLRGLDGLPVGYRSQRGERRRHLADHGVAELTLSKRLELVLDLLAAPVVRVDVQ